MKTERHKKQNVYKCKITRNNMRYATVINRDEGLMVKLDIANMFYFSFIII